MGQELGTPASVCYPQKQGRHFHSSQLRCTKSKGLLFIFPSPFATHPAARSSDCSLWLTVSYHCRICPCYAGTDYGTEIGTILRTLVRRGVAYTRIPQSVRRYQTNKNSSPVRGEGKTQRCWYGLGHKPPGALRSLGGAASPCLVEHKNIQI
jgi:hypothetical protein